MQQGWRGQTLCFIKVQFIFTKWAEVRAKAEYIKTLGSLHLKSFRSSLKYHHLWVTLYIDFAYYRVTQYSRSMKRLYGV